MEHEHTDFRSALRRAIEIVGGQKALGKACDAPRGTIGAALHHKHKLPAWLALRISAATGGQVSIEDLARKGGPPPPPKSGRHPRNPKLVRDIFERRQLEQMTFAQIGRDLGCCESHAFRLFYRWKDWASDTRS